ncbi:MAG: PadR family transcriptional regulator [Chloroflexi bacterium]|nr:PadR family transcriptional regulator [Chloroflexota bacterium]
MSPKIRVPLTIEHALLGFLRQRPMHGYEIRQQLANPNGPGMVWRLKQSNLYALLGRLEEAGYVEAALESQGARPPRRVFSLTPDGEQAFLSWVQSPVALPRQIRLEFLARLYFARQEGPQVAGRLVAQQRATCRRWLQGQQAAAAAVAPGRPFERLVHKFRSGQIEATLAWLEACAQTVAPGGA